MSASIQDIANYWSFGAFLVVTALLVGFMLAVPAMMGGRNSGRAKNEPFESGVPPFGSARLRLSAKFYLVAMFFVVFDVEALFLYLWSVSMREAGWSGYVEAVIFIAVLLGGLFYLTRVGALDWSPEDRKRRNPERNQKT